ncbi:hypothetical protein Micbo1qcDRAFT_213954 [Microdochium bolleyi]|uniref:Uncharacterized protein n=1 Tax=Microdochium bolleyi TaxID=196109 RepID=A0A136IVD5_9PEZI|nr:hypothetical protein Micbo1qcDRAFT_213954 [Microdochium bolleyi]
MPLLEFLRLILVAALFDVCIFIILVPHCIGNLDRHLKRDVRYARVLPSGSLTLVEGNDTGTTATATTSRAAWQSWGVVTRAREAPPALDYRINWLRSITWSAFRRRVVLCVLIAIFAAVLCADYGSVRLIQVFAAHILCFDRKWLRPLGIMVSDGVASTVHGVVVLAMAAGFLYYMCWLVCSTAMQAYWIYAMCRYQPGTLDAVAGPKKLEEGEISVTERENVDSEVGSDKV